MRWVETANYNRLTSRILQAEHFQAKGYLVRVARVLTLHIGKFHRGQETRPPLGLALKEFYHHVQGSDPHVVRQIGANAIDIVQAPGDIGLNAAHALEIQGVAVDDGLASGVDAVLAVVAEGLVGEGEGVATVPPQAVEELGVFGALLILILFGVLLYRLMFIAKNAPDLYGSLIATGIFAHIALQVILNIAVVTGLLPTTGITLPFISYGGTAILFLMAEMGVALGISRKIRLEGE